MTITIGRSLNAGLLRCTAGVGLLLLGACASMAQPGEPVPVGTQWAVAELDGAEIPDGVAPTLVIAQDGGVSGSDGCNRFVGGLVFQDGGKMAPSPSAGISTKMACPGARDSVSRRYNALRAEAAKWHVQNDTLVVSTADGRTVKLRRAR